MQVFFLFFVSAHYCILSFFYWHHSFHPIFVFIYQLTNFYNHSFIFGLSNTQLISDCARAMQYSRFGRQNSVSSLTWGLCKELRKYVRVGLLVKWHSLQEDFLLLLLKNIVSSTKFIRIMFYFCYSVLFSILPCRTTS